MVAPFTAKYDKHDCTGQREKQGLSSPDPILEDVCVLHDHVTSRCMKCMFIRHVDF